MNKIRPNLKMCVQVIRQNENTLSTYTNTVHIANSYCFGQQSSNYVQCTDCRGIECLLAIYTEYRIGHINSKYKLRRLVLPIQKIC